MSGERAHPGPPTAGEFRDVIGRFASGVTVVTTRHEGTPRGTTASAVTSLSLEPPMLIVCLNQTSETGQAINESGRFVVNILSEDQGEIAGAFAGKGPNKFDGITTELSGRGMPLLHDALATLECHVVEAPIGGTHFVFIAEVEHAAARDGAPLTYFSGQLGRFSHPTDEAVTDDLRTMVLDSTLPIGAALDVNELSMTLGAPATVIHTALVRLSSEGLVTRGARGGFVVDAITIEAVDDALRARAAIEIGAARLSVGTLTEAQLDTCRTLVAGLAPRAADGTPADPASWLRRALAFLDHTVALAGSSTLVEAYRRVARPAVVMSPRDSALAADELPDDIDREFREYVTALERDDLDAIVELILARTARLLEISRAALARADDEQRGLTPPNKGSDPSVDPS